MQNTITIRKRHNHWHAEYHGPIRKTIIDLFGTAEVPTAYVDSVPEQAVKEMIQARHRGCTVK